MKEIEVLSVNISEKKGTVKVPVKSIELTANGVKKDAHSGSWHRQVSLLGMESVDKFSKQANRKINFGEFAENITTKGVLLYETKPFDVFRGKNVELMVTQIGKKCHGDSCAIFKEVGNCVMPKEGIFARVIKNGKMVPRDKLEYIPKVFKITVITLSDRASSGEYADLSGPRIKELTEEHFSKLGYKSDIKIIVIPDNAEKLAEIIKKEINHADVIFTTGGTGIGPRDITVETVKPLLEKEIPGIMEFIRMKYGAEKPNALLSRGVAGVSGKTFIYTMPGSVKAVNEYMTEINKTLYHLFLMLNSIDSH